MWNNNMKNEEMEAFARSMEMQHMPKQVLLIDDSFKSLNSLRSVFEKMGCDVYTANDGESGVEHLLTDHPDLVIIDWKMPDFNADETLLRAQNVMHDIDHWNEHTHLQWNKDVMIPVIVFTALDKSTVKLPQFSNFELFDIWQKPLSIANLTTRANWAIHRI